MIICMNTVKNTHNKVAFRIVMEHAKQYYNEGSEIPFSKKYLLRCYRALTAEDTYHREQDRCISVFTDLRF